MADKNEKPSKSLSKLQQQVQDLYNTTYHVNDDNGDIETKVYDDLETAIRASTQGDSEFANISNTSKLFRKLLSNSNDTTTSNKLNKSFGTGGADDISMLFQQPQIISSLMDTYAKTKWITELDAEFDLICKYMPKLQIALDIKKDAVLCADTYTKEFLNIHAKGIDPNSDKNSIIQNNIREMAKKYDLSDKAETWYDNTSKYGEEFVYCVPYDIALDELLKRKQNTTYSVAESSITKNDLKMANEKIEAAITAAIGEDGNISINVKLDTSKVIMEAVENNYYLRRVSGDTRLKGLSESYSTLRETNDSFEDHLKKNGKDTEVKFDTTIGNEIEWEDEDRTASNGLINPNDKENNTKLKVNGAIVKSIKRDKIIPVYIEDVLFGCYHIQTDKAISQDPNANGTYSGYKSISGMFTNSPTTNTAAYAEEESRDNDLLLRSIAAQISRKVDKAFINANADLKEEIYLLLKYNDKYNKITSTNLDLDIVFIPADDIHHLKFKEDPDTHRGISDLWDSLVPAKQWITLNLTSVLGWTTRGFDRRVYYVKQSLDTNTAQSLLNVISTIKKGNFGVRQMESVNNILNIVGRFNDFVIPIGPGGEAPIQFDTQPGQQFEFPDQLITKHEEDAVNGTGVPLEIVNSSTGMDFAVRYTMTNAKLLRNVLKRQLKMSEFLSEIFTKIYRFEYGENIDIEVTLPPPAFLSMTQGQQLLSSAVQYADAYTEVEMANEDDAAKAMFKKMLVRKMMPSYMTDEELEEIKNAITFKKETDDKELYGGEE